MQIKFAFNEHLKVVLIKMVAILIMSAKFTTPVLFKIFEF